MEALDQKVDTESVSFRNEGVRVWATCGLGLAQGVFSFGVSI